MKILCPSWLTGEAKKYWQKHAKPLIDAGVLTERDVETFSLLCEVWRLLRDCDPTRDSKEALRYIGLVKQYSAMAKQFSLVPKGARTKPAEKKQTLGDVIKLVRGDAEQA